MYINILITVMAVLSTKRSRVVPNYEVSIGALQKILETWFIQRDSRDVWKLFSAVRLAVEQG